MAVTIEIPTAFRRFTDGSPKLDCTAATVAEALNILTSQYPGLSRHVRDDQGQIRQFLNIYLNDEDIRFLGGEDCAVKEGDKVLLVPSIAGRSEEHTSELQSLRHLVCRLLLEKKKKRKSYNYIKITDNNFI